MHRARLQFSKKASKELMNEAICALRMAKDIHDELEACYIGAMDFRRHEKIAAELIDRIWKSEWWTEE